MTDLVGGALLAESLYALGVRDVFTLHGGHLDTFLVAAPKVGIRLIDVRHEASAGHAAEAYAMVRPGSVGVCVVTAGPGFTNALTAMASAAANAMPTLFIAGAPPMSEESTNELQGSINQVAMASPVCKWSQRISVVERLPDLVEKALRIARSGRPGPVFLEVPINVMFGRASKVFFPLDPERPSAAPPTITAEGADQIIQALRGAERPVLIVGSGALLSGAGPAIQQFVERAGIPVVTNGKAHGVIPFDHPNYVGTAGTLGGHPPDVVLLAGARAGLLLGGRSGAIIPRNAKVLQIDIDGGEIGRLTPVSVGLTADCAEAFKVLADAAKSDAWPDWSGWAQELAEARASNPYGQAPAYGTSGRIHPHHAARAIFEAIGPDAFVAVDGGEMTAWCEPQNQASAPGRYLTAGYFGALGIGPGFAMAAAVAHPDAPVFLVSGDGAIGFNLQEFDTMARHNLPVVTIVMNNSAWALSLHAQDLMFGESQRSAVALSDTAYEAVAIALGCHGERVTDADEIGPAIRRAVARREPACINIAIDADVMHPMTYGMTGSDPKKGKISMPYYQND